jgi:hypothetical protein
MPAEEQVIIVISGKDAASKIFKSVGMEAEKTGKKIEKGLGDKLKKVGDSMSKVGKKLTVGLTAPLGLFAGAAINSAMKADRLQKTLNGLAGGADEAAKFINAIKTASQGTVPQIEALAIANRALSFGVVKNTGEMEKLTKVAIALGRAQGLDAATAVSDLTTALSRNSPMILDNLGITLKLTEAYRIYADKIGVSADALNEEQKAIAFREAALIKGMEVVERMGGLQDDMAASSERAAAKMKDVGVQVGQILLPAFSSGVDIAGSLIGKFQELSPEMQKIVVFAGAGAAALGPLMTVVGNMVGPTVDLAKNFATLASNMGLSAGAFGAVGLAIAGAIAAIQLIRGELREFEGIQVEVDAELDVFITKLHEAKAAGESLAPAIEGASGAIQTLRDEYEDANAVTKIFNNIQGQQKDRAEDVHSAIIQTADTYEQYTASVDQHNSVVKDSVAKIQEQVFSLNEFGDEVGGVREGLLLLTEEQFKYNLVLRELEAGTGAAAHETRKLEEGYRMGAAGAVAFDENTTSAEESVKSFAETLAEGTEGFRNVERAAAMAADEMGGVGVMSWEEFKAGKAAAEEYQSKVSEAHAMVAASAEESAARQVAAAAEAARGQAELINSMKDATQEMFNQQILAAIDPAEIGVEAWAGLGQELGLLDEKQVNLATAADALISAFQEGIIPTENMAEAAGALFAESDKLEPKFGLILDHFSAAPGLVGPSQEAMEAHHGIMVDMNDILPDAASGVDDVGSAMAEARTPTEELRDSLEDVRDLLTDLAGDHAINLNISQTGSPPSLGSGGDRAQMGLRVPGPIGSSQGPYWLHGGEVVSNPYQRGAVGGPGGPPTTNNYGGDTNFNVNINDRMAAALFLDQMRRQRGDKLNARM